MTLAGSEEAADGVVGTVAADGTEVDEGIAHAGLGESVTGHAQVTDGILVHGVVIDDSPLAATGVGVFVVARVAVIVVAVAAAEDVDDMTLTVLHIGRGFQHVGRTAVFIIFIDKGQGGRRDMAAHVALARDSATQVVATVDVVAYVGKAADTYVGLRMPQYGGITGSGK